MTSILDPLFGPPSVLPYPAGTGPFRQKGNGYLGDFEYIDKNVPGGFKAVVAAIQDASIRTFFEQRFRGSEWYDAFPGPALHAAAARMRGISFGEQRRQVGAYHAHVSGGGIYRALLRVVSNENIAVWGPRVSSIYFEFGKTETRATGPKEVTGVRRGLPAGLVQFIMHVSKGFTEETLLLAGAKTSSFDIGAIEPEDRAYGQQLYKVDFVIRWT